MEDILGQYKDLNMWESNFMIKVFIAGQKQLAKELFQLCLKHDIKVIKCCIPEGDIHFKNEVLKKEISIINPGKLTRDDLQGIDIAFCAHYFGFISSELLLSTRLGWLGYHPSLLPIYRGRNSIVDTIMSKDKIAGGSLYWLNESMDKGDIAYQDFIVIDPKFYELPFEESVKRIWVEHLSPLGIKLFEKAIIDLKEGVIRRKPQKRVIV